MSRPLDDNGNPFLLLPHSSGPTSAEEPSLIDSNTASLASRSPQQPPSPVPFRKPTAPSSIASHKKRAYEDDVSSPSSPSKRSRASDPSFASAYKSQLIATYRGCSVCGVVHNLHSAHVFDKAATYEFAQWRQRGTVSLETLGDFENALCLCGGDHLAYDANYCQLIIVPTYMEYFFDHERRWQQRIETMARLTPRSPVTPTLYAAHCSEITGNTLTQGLYTAFPVVDYKNKDDVGSPRQFYWHGDPGAILWKARHLFKAELGVLTPRPAHIQELKNVRKLLAELKELQEQGDEKWNAAVAASLITNGPPSDHPSDEGNGAGTDSSKPTPHPPPLPQPPPPPAPPSGHPGAAYSPFPTTHNLKRKQASSDSAVGISEPRPWKAAKPSNKDLSMALQQAYSIRWGGPESSTEETVQHWNALFGKRA